MPHSLDVSTFWRLAGKQKTARAQKVDADADQRGHVVMIESDEAPRAGIPQRNFSDGDVRVIDRNAVHLPHQGGEGIPLAVAGTLELR